MQLRFPKRPNLNCLSLFVLATLLCPNYSAAGEPEARWWKGNLHTHTLWSDGNEFPEMVAAWYAEHDYNFLGLSDHNVLSQGQRWMAVDTVANRADEEAIERYQQKFGQQWVQLQGSLSQADCKVRLKPLDEFRHRVEQAGKFIMIQSEEISDKADGKPVHMNATNMTEVIHPVGGETVQAAMQNNLRLVLEHEKATGRQILPHLNHPNFGYAITAADIAHTIDERFFEIFNGHPDVYQLGDDKHQSIESMWDSVNALRLARLDADPIYGIGTDDCHHYHKKGNARPGRAWVMVRATYLTPEYLIQAMKAGDFYASTGVALSDIQFDTGSRKLSLTIMPQTRADGTAATYETQFIILPKTDVLPKTDATPAKPNKAADSPSNAANQADSGSSTDRSADLPVAVVASTVKGLTPSFTLPSEAYYVRAIVNSSLPHDSPTYPQQKQQAWTQPVGWKK